jgi:polar amino acid transport system substrate-binding protein
MWKHVPIFALWAAAVPVFAAPPAITVAWRDKPPYHFVEHGEEKGFLLERSRKIFELAKINATFVREPSKRIWANFQNGARNYCSIGWYFLPERLPFVQYSAPMHIDEPHLILVAQPSVAAVSAHASLKSLLADKSLTLGVIDGVSYGIGIDALIQASHNQVLRRVVEPGAMVRMLAAGRASFMFIDREDYNHLVQADPVVKQVVRREFTDMPPGLQRYVVCSKDVAPMVIARINRAISTTLEPQSK